MVAKLLLEPGPRCPGLDMRRQRARVDFEHAVKRLEVDGDHARVPVAHPGLDSPHHACSPSERNHCRAGARGPLEHIGHLALASRPRDHVGQVRESTAEGANDVGVGTPVSVQAAFVVVGSADRGQ